MNSTLEPVDSRPLLGIASSFPDTEKKDFQKNSVTLEIDKAHLLLILNLGIRKLPCLHTVFAIVDIAAAIGSIESSFAAELQTIVLLCNHLGPRKISPNLVVFSAF